MKLDISAYCNKEIHCACGRTHLCPIEHVEVSCGALNQLPTIMGSFKHIFLVADTNTWAVCGAPVYDLLRTQANGCHVYERPGMLVPDERAIDELMTVLPENTDLVLGIGSGVINDLCKYVTWKKGLECAIVATAPSMDGFASSGAAMITDGMKVTYTTHPPKYIIADVDIIKEAPMDMIRAGYGDIIGKYSSLNDWKLANLINGEYLCQPIVDLVTEVTDNIRDSVDAIVAREADAIALLMKALVLIGMTLSLVGSTRPGSGSEHHLSHFFEITGLVHNKPHFIHGTDVAYASILVAGMRQQICAQKTPQFCCESTEERIAAWNRIYGNVSTEVQALQAQAGVYACNREAEYTAKWPQILEILGSCPSAQEFRQMMEAVGFKMDAFEAMYGSEKICDAMLYGKDLKDRYSFLWIYYLLFSGKKEEVTWMPFLQN